MSTRNQATMQPGLRTALFGTRVPRVLIGMLVIVAVAEGAFLTVRYLLTPWARAHDGRPPLVGYWQGTLDFGRGDHRQVVMHLRVFETAGEFLMRGGKASWDGTPQPDLRVVAKICGAKSNVQYHGEGRVAERNGSQFSFSLGSDGQTPGKHPSSLEAVWDGNDRIQLTARWLEHGADSSVAVATATARSNQSDPGEVARFELTRITEQGFAASC
jgi:hypothetical protein